MATVVSVALVVAWDILRPVSPSSAILNYALITRNNTNPYYRLFEEMAEHLTNKTAPGGEFDGFFIYTNPPKNRSLHFPCIVLEMERGNASNMFGRDYEESGTIVMKIMFTYKEVEYIDVM